MHPHDLDAHALSEHHRRLQLLARSMLGDSDRANDAVQDTWLASLRAPAPRGPRAPWLAGILRHRVLQHHRADARRAEHEAQTARPLASTDEVDSALAHGRALVDSLDRLEEPYRTAIVLRYLRELPPPSIATRLGIPLETVRTRLRRGLALLRERLDREHAGWAVAFLPAAPAAAPASTVAGTATLPLILGGWMATKLAAAVLGLALIAVLVWSNRTATDPAPVELAAMRESAPALPAADAPPTPAPLAEEPSLRTPAASERTSTTVAEALEPPLLHIRLEGWQPTDAGDVRLSFDVADSSLALPRSDADERPLIELARRPEDSEIRLSLPSLLGEQAEWPSTLALTSEHPDYLPARTWVVPADDVDIVDAVLHLERAALVVRGAAHGPSGVALPHGRAALFQLGAQRLEIGGALVGGVAPQQEPEELVDLDETGAFRLRSRGSGAHVLVVYETPQQVSVSPSTDSAETLAPLTRRLPASATRDLDLGALELDAGFAIRGSVPAWRDYGGVVMARTTDLGNASPMLGNLCWVEDVFAHVLLETHVTRDGRFELEGLAPLEYELTATTRGNAEGEARTTLSFGEVSVASLRVRAPAEGIELSSDNLRCELGVFSAGAPLLGASVSLQSALRSRSTSLPRSHLISLEFQAGEQVELVVQHAEHESRTLELSPTTIPADGVLRVELEPAAARAAFTLVGTGPHAAELSSGHFAVQLQKLEPGGQKAAAQRSISVFQSRPSDQLVWHPGNKPPSLRMTRADGCVHVEGVPAGRYYVVAAPLMTGERTSAPFVLDFELELVPGEDRPVEWPVELGPLARVTITGEPSSPFESLRLIGPNGAIDGLYWHKVEATGDSWSSSTNPFPTGRSVAQGPLAPGAYRLEFFRANAMVHVQPFDLTLEGSPEVLVDVSGL